MYCWITVSVLRFCCSELMSRFVRLSESSPFLSSIQESLSRLMLQMPSKYTFTQLMDKWVNSSQTYLIIVMRNVRLDLVFIVTLWPIAVDWSPNDVYFPPYILHYHFNTLKHYHFNTLKHFLEQSWPNVVYNVNGNELELNISLPKSFKRYILMLSLHHSLTVTNEQTYWAYTWKYG